MASVTAMAEADDKIRINRAPVLTLWAAAVAERLGFDRATALTLGQAVAGLSGYARACPWASLSPGPSWCASGATVERMNKVDKWPVELVSRAIGRRGSG